MGKTLAMIHNNPIRVADGRLFVDRKFHIGMRYYVGQVDARIVTVHPTSAPSSLIMDQVEVSCDELGYEVVTVDVNRAGQPTAAGVECLRELLAKCDLMYGYGLGCIGLARELDIPYVMVLEYDLRTQIVVTTTAVSSPLRKVSRAVKCAVSYACDALDMRQARSVHCNGYPIYDETARFNANRLLYLDSRMPASLVIPEDQLLSRLQSLPHRTLRLLYSGRYEPMKGAADAVSVAVDCLRQGMDIEMHCYGQGRLRDEMRRIATQAPVAGRIFVHDAIPYPELAARAREFDLFVCCHIQSDPSCTYLESFGAGVPIVGYVNRMWGRMQAESDAGLVAPVHQPHQIAAKIRQLIGDVPSLRNMSVRARHFALAHSSEQEFAKRVSSINAVLGEAG